VSFEEEYGRLEKILVRLEGGDLTLEESLGEYEQGIGALRACREILDKAELKIRELSPDPEPKPEA
jgi:exodeoxyribonuclease VII small subunit